MNRREKHLSGVAQLSTISRAAMAAAGWHAHIECFPNSDSPNHLALVSFDPIDYVTERDRLRAQAIWARRTDRLPFSPPTDWKSIASIWAGDVDGKAVRIDTIPDDVLPKLIEAAQMAESLRALRQCLPR